MRILQTLLFFKLRCFQRAGFDGFKAINKFADWPNLPPSLHFFYKKTFFCIFTIFLKPLPQFLISLLVDWRFTDALRSWRTEPAIYQANLCKDAWILKWCMRLYVCMYLMIGKGQIAQKRPYWGENRLKAKCMGKYNYLVVFWKLGDPVPMLLQVVNGSGT